MASDEIEKFRLQTQSRLDQLVAMLDAMEHRKTEKAKRKT